MACACVRGGWDVWGGKGSDRNPAHPRIPPASATRLTPHLRDRLPCQLVLVVGRQVLPLRAGEASCQRLDGTHAGQLGAPVRVRLQLELGAVRGVMWEDGAVGRARAQTSVCEGVSIG